MRQLIAKLSGIVRNNRRETITGVDQGRIGGAGETTVVAGRDVSMAAGVITSDVNTGDGRP